MTTTARARTILFRLAPQARRKLNLLACAFMVLPVTFLIFGLFMGDQVSLIVAGILTLMFSPVSAYLYFCGRYPLIILSQSGIDLRGVIGAGSLHVDWNKIERLRTTLGREGLILNAPLNVKATQRLANTAGIRFNGVSMYDPEQKQMIAEQRWIPFNGFAGWLRQGKLLDELRRFAPRLADEYVAALPEIEKQKKRNSRNTIIFAVVMLLILTPAVLFGLYYEQLPEVTQAAWDQYATICDNLFRVVLIPVLALTAVVNLQATWRRLRQKSYGYALLWFSAALVQGLIAMALLGECLPKS